MRKRFFPGMLPSLVLLIATCWAGVVAAQDFYKGKTIRLIVATTPGGGFDAYSRMLTRHMGKHLSGNPTFVVENMPGASFLIGTNYLYRQAKPDGLTLGNWIGTLVLHQLTGREGIEFDARKFEYVGAPVKNHDTCVMTRARASTAPKNGKARPSRSKWARRLPVPRPTTTQWS